MKAHYLASLALGILTVFAGCAPRYYEIKGYRIESKAISQITGEQMNLFANAIDTNGDKTITAEEMDGLLRKVELGQKAQSKLESIVNR